MDLDGFKHVNDTLGHNAGDQLLKLLTSRLQELLCSSDTVARLGGDEFIILAQNFDSERHACHIAEKIITTIAPPVNLDGYDIQVTTSLGIALFPIEDDNVSSLLRKSDSAMYQSKKSGKNKWYFLSGRQHVAL